MQLNRSQELAARKFHRWWKLKDKPTFEISGAAGTGKTYLVRHVLEGEGIDIDKVLFMAYVGKATLAMRMNGINATTIHKAITLSVKEKVMEGDHQLVIDGRPQWQYKFYPREHLNDDIKLIVVDEGSMVPGYMAKWLLDYDIPVIVLGDLNQLPPVGGSSYFLQNPDAILTQIMRQASDSPIPYIAQYAIAGDERMFNNNLNIEDKVIIKRSNELSDDEM
jgi:exodeoxyribonuclease-5